MYDKNDNCKYCIISSAILIHSSFYATSMYIIMLIKHIILRQLLITSTSDLIQSTNLYQRPLNSMPTWPFLSDTKDICH